MDTMRGALERAKMLVGMEVDEESGLPSPEEQSFFDDINRNCTLNTTQASTHARLDRPGEPWLRADLAADLARGAACLRGDRRGFAVKSLEQCGAAV